MNPINLHTEGELYGLVMGVTGACYLRCPTDNHIQGRGLIIGIAGAGATRPHEEG